MKSSLILSTIFALASCTPVYAQTSLTCEQRYREAYTQYALTGAKKYEELAYIYTTFFDFQNGLAEAYDSGRPLFRELKVKAGDEKLALQRFADRLKSGSLCDAGSLKTWSEIAELLR